MQGSVIPITLGKALICRNLHGLEGEGRYAGAESGAKNMIHPAVRDKESRGTARDRDEWKPVCRVGLMSSWSWGCTQGQVLPYFLLLALPWCLATLGRVLGREQQSPGDTGRERSKRDRTPGPEARKYRPASDTSKTPANGAQGSALWILLTLSAPITEGSAHYSEFSLLMSWSLIPMS